MLTKVQRQRIQAMAAHPSAKISSEIVGPGRRKVLITAANHLPCNVGEFRNIDVPLAMKDAREILEACRGKAAVA